MGMHGASHPMLTYLDRVLVSEIHTVDPWEQAPRGTLLQVSYKGGPVVALRCGLKTTDTQDSLVIMSGEFRGTLLIPPELPEPALDISRLVELVAIDPQPFFPDPSNFKRGMLFARDDDRLVYYRTPGRTTGFVCVHGAQIGETFENLDMKTIIGISQQLGVQLRSILYAGSGRPTSTGPR
jgi:hypothetical protein